MLTPIPKPTRKLICAKCGLSNEKIKGPAQNCRNCGAPLFTTVNGLPVYFGPVTPRPDIVISPKLPPKGLPKTAIKKTGKLGLKWLAFRKAWLAANPPDWKGEYTCGICGRPVHISEVTLDHIIPRSRDPRRCFDPENIQPSHGECNLIKGSRIQLVDGRFH